jgi:hypothetical protein
MPRVQALLDLLAPTLAQDAQLGGNSPAVLPFLLEHGFQDAATSLQRPSLRLEPVDMPLQLCFSLVVLLPNLLKLILKLAYPRCPPLSEGSLRSPVLGLPLRWWGVGGRLAARFRPGRNYPFLACYGKRPEGIRLGDDGRHGHLAILSSRGGRWSRDGLNRRMRHNRIWRCRCKSGKIQGR